MTTIKEDYVSFEIAKLLKEKGFDEGCSFVANTISKGVMPVSWPTTNSEIEDEKASLITLPTIQMTMKWLRELHKLYINIWADPKDVENNDFDIIFRAQVYNGSSNYGTHEFSTYEQACEAEIKYCLENLI